MVSMLRGVIAPLALSETKVDVIKMNLVLDPENIIKDDLFTFEVFLDNLQLTDLLVFNKMVSEEINNRIDIMDRRYDMTKPR